MVERFLGFLRDGRPAHVAEEVERLTLSGLSSRSIYLRVFAPALVKIGSLWEEGVISVAEEHLATALVRAQMARLAPLPPQLPSMSGRVVLAAVPGELHAVGLRMVADFLEGDGWEVADLAQSTPRDDLVRFVRMRRPHVVGLSCGLIDHLGEAAAVVRALRSLPDTPVVLVGGSSLAHDPAAAGAIGADVVAKDAQEACGALQQRFE